MDFIGCGFYRREILSEGGFVGGILSRGILTKNQISQCYLCFSVKKIFAIFAIVAKILIKFFYQKILGEKYRHRLPHLVILNIILGRDYPFWTFFARTLTARRGFSFKRHPCSILYNLQQQNERKEYRRWL